MRKVKHGLCKHKLHKRWGSIKQRCNNTNDPSYHNYGGRGIKMCDEWNDFKNFYDWSMANGYKSELTIDRIDNNKGYSPDNCRYVTWRENQNNKRTNVLITIFGETKTIYEWSRDKRCKVGSHTFFQRIATYKMNPQEALTTKAKFSGDTSKYRGVSWDRNNKKWIVRIKYNYKDKYLGEFFNDKAAAIMYNIYAYKFWGDKAKLNIFNNSG